MELLFALSLLILSFATGLMAGNFGRNAGLWFCISIPLPFIASIILLCLPDRSTAKARILRPVENEEIFDHLFIKKYKKLLPAHRLVNFGVLSRKTIIKCLNIIL
jgi:hypothetical protein